MKTKQGLFTRTILLLLAVACGPAINSQADPCFVDSTNHGGGLFSYTFRRGDVDYVWGLGANFGRIYIQSFGVIAVWEPLGWTHSISSSGLVTWTVTNGTVYLDEPVTFHVQSCLTESANYPYQLTLSAIISTVFRLPEHTRLGGGFQRFDFVGPAIPKLSVERTNDTVSIRWPAGAKGLQLESCEALSPQSWAAVTNTPITDTSSHTVVLPAASPAKFFRLVTPCVQPPP